MTFSHKAVYGATTMGKSWLMKRLSNVYAKNKQQIIVYSGVGDFDGWARGAKMTTEVAVLEEWLNDPNNFQSFVFLDEITVLNDETKPKKHPTVHGIFMRGRHRGFTCFGATQYPTAMQKRNRVNCMECYCFRLGDEDSAQLVWKDYGQKEVNGRPAWQEILDLKQLEFLHFMPDGQVVKKHL